MIGTAQPQSPLSISSVAQLTLSLLVIVALILAVGWMLKRFKLTGARSRGDIAVLDELLLGPRERVVLLRVGDRQLLIGVGAGGVVGLTPLPTPIALSGLPAAPEFVDRLRDFMRRPGSAA